MQVTVPRPDVKGRTEILNWYLSKIKVDPGRFQFKIFKNIEKSKSCKFSLSSSTEIILKHLKLYDCESAFVCHFCKEHHCVLTTDHLYKEGIFYCFTAVDAEIIARGTVGFSGAELENLVNQSALKAAVDEKEMVTMKDLEFAKDKILMGEYTQPLDPLCVPHVTSRDGLPQHTLVRRQEK